MKTELGYPNVFCLVGYSGVGKSSLAIHLSERIQSTQVISTGRLLTNFSRNRNIQSFLSIQDVDESIASLSDNEEFIELVKSSIRMNSKHVVIDSLKRFKELGIIKSRIPNVRVLGIDLPEEERIQRIKGRARSIDPKSEAEFIRLAQKEDANGVGDLMQSADFVICNSGDREVFYKTAVAIVKNCVN